MPGKSVVDLISPRKGQSVHNLRLQLPLCPTSPRGWLNRRGTKYQSLTFSRPYVRMANMIKRNLYLVLIVGFLLLAVALSGVASSAVGTASSTNRTPSPRAPRTYAYGLVSPPCGGCGKLPKNFTPLKSAYSMNLTLGSALSGAPLGTWCFVLKNGINPSTATLVPSVVSVESPRVRRFGLEDARWVVGAPNCVPNQIEIRTFGLAIESGNLVSVPNNEIAFSFVVD